MVNDLPGGLIHIGQMYLLDADDVSFTTQTVCCQHKQTVHYTQYNTYMYTTEYSSITKCHIELLLVYTEKRPSRQVKQRQWVTAEK